MSKPDAPGESSSVHRGFVVNVRTERVTLANGHQVDLDIVPHPGASTVAPITADGDVILIRQYRHATGGTIYEVPAGKLDPGESPEVCAARELEEEAGVRAGRLVDLGWIWTTPGFTDEKIFLFAGLDLTPVATRHQDDEVIETVTLPLAEALAMVWRGELNDAKSALTFLHVAKHLGRLA